MKALFAEAELLSKGNQQGNPRMVELIDTIMSIPSCLQDQHSKVQVVPCQNHVHSLLLIDSKVQAIP